MFLSHSVSLWELNIDHFYPFIIKRIYQDKQSDEQLQVLRLLFFDFLFFLIVDIIESYIEYFKLLDL